MRRTRGELTSRARRDWSEVVRLLADQLRDLYVDPELGEQVAAVLEGRLAAGAYDAIPDDASFADAISRETLEASGDRHLLLRYSQVHLPVLDSPIVPESGRRPEEAALAGHGFRRVERLAGNVGLVEIRQFFPARFSGQSASAAMALVADSDVLLIDLRQCRGGEPDMVALVESHLFDERTEMTAIHFPRENRTVQWWTDPYLPGPRFGGTKPVFALIGPDTFSAGEGFSYDLQQSGRAVLVGEPTPRGVSTFDFRYRVNDHLMFSVPSGVPVHPRSGRSWAPEGVQPDLRVPSDDAFVTAYRLALDHVLTLRATGAREAVASEAVLARSALAMPRSAARS